jgi:hypothetical protein
MIIWTCKVKYELKNLNIQRKIIESKKKWVPTGVEINDST